MAEVYYPVGRYQCRIKQQGFDTTSTGKPQFVLTFTVFGAESGESVPQKDRAYYKVITERTIEYLVTDLQNLGVQVASLSALDPANPNHVSLVGKEVVMFCKHGTDQNGNEKEEWSPGLARREFTPPPAAELSRLDMLFGRAMKSAGITPKPAGPAAPARQPVPPPPPQPVAAGNVADDDVPF